MIMIECKACLKHLATKLKPVPPFDNEAFYIVECAPTPTSTSEILESRYLYFTGAFGAENIALIEQLYRIVWKPWTPCIEAKHRSNSSVSLACRCIGYLSMLFSVELVDESEFPYRQYDISSLFIETILVCLDYSIARLMELARDGRHEIDAESRPGVYLLYIYLSAFDTLRKKWGNCTIFVSFLVLSYYMSMLTSD
jgi:hypothetical protein